MLTYIGGMQMTPAADERAVADRRSAGNDANAAAERLSRFSGIVSLSKNGQRP